MSAEPKQPTNAAKIEEAVRAARPGAVPASKRADIYTVNAREGLNVAELVNAAFKAKKPVGKQTSYRVEVIEPDGPSTSGGKRARQTIRLIGGTAPVMIGYLDVAQRVAELRTYDSVSGQYEDRFGAPFDVKRDEYDTLSRDLETILAPFQYTFGIEADDRTARGVPRAVRNKTPLLVAVLLGGLVALGALVALALMR